MATPGTRVELRGTRVGRIDSYRFWETLDTISILDSVVGAEQQGFDAVAIGNILDPGLRDARSMVDIPVLGLGETCMLASCMMGSRFSLVGVNPYFGGRFEENVARYGLKERLAGIAFMSLTPHELDACFSDESGRGRALEAFLSAARSTLDAGSEVVIPAGGRLTAFLNAQGVREVDGAPVLDGTATLVAHDRGGRARARRGRHHRQPSQALRQGPGGRHPRCGGRVRRELPPARAPRPGRHRRPPKPATEPRWHLPSRGEIDVPAEQAGDIRVQSGPDTGGRRRRSRPRSAALREAVDAAGPLDAKQRELVLLAGFAATRNEGGFRVHCTRLAQAGAGLAEVEHVVLMMLGTSLGLATAVDALRWAHEELADGTI